MTLRIVILAAGLGKRMHSDMPKVLHRLAGKTLLEHVAHTASQLSANPPLIVYGHQGEVVRHTLAHLNADWVEQKEQRGTGHALRETLPLLPDETRVLVLNGDVPLINIDTLKQLLNQTPTDAIGMITA